MTNKDIRSIWKNHGLSITLILIFFITFYLQILTGWMFFNEEMQQEGGKLVTWREYLGTGHFLYSTFENWQSEFLQMAAFILLTIKLYQKGSAESKQPDEQEEVDREPKVSENAPWPVKKGGVWLTLYKNSLFLAFVFLFIISFALHLYGSFKDENLLLSLKGEPAVSLFNYIIQTRFWYETFQNWQSEFISIASIVLLTVWLRQKGSPESKPVDTPHWESE